MILVWFLDLKFVSETAASNVTNFKSTTLDQDDIGLNQANIISLIDSKKIEHDPKSAGTFRIML